MTYAAQLSARDYSWPWSCTTTRLSVGSTRVCSVQHAPRNPCATSWDQTRSPILVPGASKAITQVLQEFTQAWSLPLAAHHAADTSQWETCPFALLFKMFRCLLAPRPSWAVILITRVSLLQESSFGVPVSATLLAACSERRGLQNSKPTKMFL